MGKKRIVYTALVTLVVVFSTSFAILMTLERMDYRNYLQGEYSKSMYELIDSVQNIRVDLGKSEIVGSREQSIVVFEDIFRYSTMANDKLHSLPISEQTTAETGKFLSQVGDFCFTLAKYSSEGKELTEEDYKTIGRLKENAFGLEEQLKNVSSDINAGKVKWAEIRKKASGIMVKAEEPMVSDKFKGIQKQVLQYPALIYDGPFSDNVMEIKPKISGEKDVSQKEAEKVAQKIIGENRVESISFIKAEGKAKIETYRFSVTIKGRKDKKDNVICEVSKKGGKVLYLIDNRKVGNTTMNVKKAIAGGSKYLEGIGYNNMISTYALNYGNTAVINYVYTQQNVVVYPDQIKLKVALDDGSIVGIESEKYLVAHEQNRNIQAPKISQDAAKGRVSKRLKVTSVRLALVPTENNKEVLCYEFSGSYKEDNFIVYINATTGFEQKIVQIINTPNGQLTM